MGDRGRMKGETGGDHEYIHTYTRAHIPFLVLRLFFLCARELFVSLCLMNERKKKAMPKAGYLFAHPERKFCWSSSSCCVIRRFMQMQEMQIEPLWMRCNCRLSLFFHCVCICVSVSLSNSCDTPPLAFFSLFRESQRTRAKRWQRERKGKEGKKEGRTSCEGWVHIV